MTKYGSGTTGQVCVCVYVGGWVWVCVYMWCVCACVYMCMCVNSSQRKRPNFTKIFVRDLGVQGIITIFFSFFFLLFFSF